MSADVPNPLNFLTPRKISRSSSLGPSVLQGKPSATMRWVQGGCQGSLAQARRLGAGRLQLVLLLLDFINACGRAGILFAVMLRDFWRWVELVTRS